MTDVKASTTYGVHSICSLHTERSAFAENEDEQDEGDKAIWWWAVGPVRHGKNTNQEDSSAEELGEEARDCGEKEKINN